MVTNDYKVLMAKTILDVKVKQDQVRHANLGVNRHHISIIMQI